MKKWPLSSFVLFRQRNLFYMHFTFKTRSASHPFNSIFKRIFLLLKCLQSIKRSTIESRRYWVCTSCWAFFVRKKKSFRWKRKTRINSSFYKIFQQWLKREERICLITFSNSEKCWESEKRFFVAGFSDDAHWKYCRVYFKSMLYALTDAL